MLLADDACRYAFRAELRSAGATFRNRRLRGRDHRAADALLCLCAVQRHADDDGGGNRRSADMRRPIRFHHDDDGRDGGGAGKGVSGFTVKRPCSSQVLPLLRRRGPSPYRRNIDALARAVSLHLHRLPRCRQPWSAWTASLPTPRSWATPQSPDPLNRPSPHATAHLLGNGGWPRSCPLGTRLCDTSCLRAPARSPSSPARTPRAHRLLHLRLRPLQLQHRLTQSLKWWSPPPV